MHRILVSQTANNDGQGLYVVDGVLVKDADQKLAAHRKTMEANNWRNVYHSEEFQMRRNGNALIMQAYFTNKDHVGRRIFFMYFLDDLNSTDELIQILKKDANQLERQIDADTISMVISSIQKDKKLMKIITAFLAAIVFGLACYYIIKKI